MFVCPVDIYFHMKTLSAGSRLGENVPYHSSSGALSTCHLNAQQVQLILSPLFILQQQSPSRKQVLSCRRPVLPSHHCCIKFILRIIYEVLRTVRSIVERVVHSIEYRYCTAVSYRFRTPDTGHLVIRVTGTNNRRRRILCTKHDTGTWYLKENFEYIILRSIIRNVVCVIPFTLYTGKNMFCFLHRSCCC